MISFLTSTIKSTACSLVRTEVCKMRLCCILRIYEYSSIHMIINIYAYMFIAYDNIYEKRFSVFL